MSPPSKPAPSPSTKQSLRVALERSSSTHFHCFQGTNEGSPIPMFPANRNSRWPPQNHRLRLRRNRLLDQVRVQAIRIRISHPTTRHRGFTSSNQAPNRCPPKFTEATIYFRVPGLESRSLSSAGLNRHRSVFTALAQFTSRVRFGAILPPKTLRHGFPGKCGPDHKGSVQHILQKPPFPPFVAIGHSVKRRLPGFPPVIASFYPRRAHTPLKCQREMPAQKTFLHPYSSLLNRELWQQPLIGCALGFLLWSLWPALERKRVF